MAKNKKVMVIGDRPTDLHGLPAGVIQGQHLAMAEQIQELTCECQRLAIECERAEAACRHAQGLCQRALEVAKSWQRAAREAQCEVDRLKMERNRT